jgi:hypothetical protein
MTFFSTCFHMKAHGGRTMAQWLLTGLLLGSFVFAHQARAAEEVVAGSVYDEAKERDVVQKARRRVYPGGRDEGDLTVQSQLPAPTRKMTPQVEAGVEAAGDD